MDVLDTDIKVIAAFQISGIAWQGSDQSLRLQLLSTLSSLSQWNSWIPSFLTEAGGHLSTVPPDVKHCHLR